MDRSKRNVIESITQSNPAIAAGLFVLSMLVRLPALGRFITADEPRWVVRSLAFFEGILSGNWAQTLQTGHPGVTTMWGGSLGAALYYLLFRPADSLATFLASLSHNYQRIDPFIFSWMRLSIVLLTSLGVAALFWLLKKADRRLAIIAALLLSFHPLYLGHSQILHHDAPVAVFAMLAVLGWLRWLNQLGWKWAALTGVATGLALLSKSTAYALFPFMALTWFIELAARRIDLKQAIRGGLLWLAVTFVTVVALWPALWVAPADVFAALFNWAADSAEVEAVSNTLLPSQTDTLPWLGIFFYPVNWLLKTTPLMLLGFAFVPLWWKNRPKDDLLKRWLGYLVLWIAIFSVMLTLGDKRDGRYLLPVYFALCVLAAAGLQGAWAFLAARWPLRISPRLSAYPLVFAALLAISLPAYPYYLAYYNPLVGGAATASKLIRVGWGDGMETAAHWLNAQPDAEHLKVATILEQSFWLWFKGDVVSPQTDRIFSADYVLNYHRQVQNEVPFPEYFEYYAARPSVFELKHAGIDYLSLYHLPPLASLGRIPVGGSDLTLRAYTLNASLIAPAETVTVTLIWRDVNDPARLVQVQARDLAGQVWATSSPAPVIDPAGPSKVEGHYALSLPAEMPRGSYTLWIAPAQSADWVKFAPLPVGYSQPPQPPPDFVTADFGGSIGLRGFEVSDLAPAPAETVTLRLWWKSIQPMPVSYTMFVHVIDASGTKIAQRDLLPGDGAFSTDTWLPGEWLVDSISLTLAADAPPGDYTVLLGWYNLQTGERLPVTDDQSGQNVVSLTEITVR